MTQPQEKFYIVSTPIGNIEDITFRAKRVLGEVDYIAAEDTRQAGKLLGLLELPKKNLISYRDQNHNNAFPKILHLLKENKTVALISDRGTPTISDPGFKLVRDLQNEGFQAITVPGPSAVTSALSISGLPTDNFLFLGFLPKKQSKVKTTLEKYSKLDTTLVIYESPNRLTKTLNTITKVYPKNKVAIIKELTKLNENVYKGTAEELLTLLNEISNKGEWVVLIDTRD